MERDPILLKVHYSSFDISTFNFDLNQYRIQTESNCSQLKIRTILLYNSRAIFMLNAIFSLVEIYYTKPYMRGKIVKLSLLKMRLNLSIFIHLISSGENEFEENCFHHYSQTATASIGFGYVWTKATQNFESLTAFSFEIYLAIARNRSNLVGICMLSCSLEGSFICAYFSMHCELHLYRSRLWLALRLRPKLVVYSKYRNAIIHRGLAFWARAVQWMFPRCSYFSWNSSSWSYIYVARL